MKLLIITTVPLTLDTILRDQPHFLNKRYEVAIASSKKEYIKKIARYEGVDFYHIPMKRRISPFFDMLSILFLIKAIIDFKPDVTHSYTPKAGFITAISSFLCMVPHRIHTFTGLVFPTEHGVKNKLLLNVDRLICSLSSYIVPEGYGVKKDLSKFNVTKKPLNVIGSGNVAGVNAEHYSPRNTCINFEQIDHEVVEEIRKKFVYCFIGRITREKGVQELVESFCLLAKKHDVFLLVAGDFEGHDVTFDMTRKQILEHNRIKYLGFLQDIRPVLCLSDCLVLPSYREGFPNVVLQAGAMEKPCIVTDVNGSNEIIIERFNGLVIEPHDHSGLYHAMDIAASMSNEKLREMGKRARTRIVENFEQEKYWKQLVQFYDNL